MASIATEPLTWRDPAAYYADLTREYERYARGAHGWHYGVWEPDVRSHYQALIRSNELLLRGLDVGPETRILDVGSGSGGFAVWAAARFGCQVTGITICAEHVELASGLAERSGVGHRCHFLQMDMDHLDLPAGSFDCVTNQDTFCHSAAKQEYLRSVRRVLRPGGSWRAIDFAVQEAQLSAEQQRGYRTVLAGFHLTDMARGSDVRRMLHEAGYEAALERDVTAEVRRTARLISRHCYVPLALAMLRLDWMTASRDARKRKHCRWHAAAALAYSRGLLAGHFRHLWYSASRPDSGPAQE